MSDSPAITFRSALLTLLILAFLGLWSMYDVVNGPGTERQERVAATPGIPGSLRSIPRFIKDARFHIQKRYAFKDGFVFVNGAAKRAIFTHSSAADVIFGANGFFFLNSHETIGMVQGLDRLSEDQSAVWATHFDTVRQAFETAELPFIFAMAPSKHTIYSDALPNWIFPALSPQTRFQDILSLAQDRLSPPPVNLVATLHSWRADNPDDLLYHRTDTHWNELGAAVAMHAAFGAQGIKLPPIQAQALVMPRGGDLARMVGQQASISEIAPVLITDAQWGCFRSDGTPLAIETIDPLVPRRFSCQSDSDDDRMLVVFTDSFGVPAIPTLASSFQRTEFIWTDQVDPKQAAMLGADMVLQIIVERKFMTVSPGALLAP